MIGIKRPAKGIEPKYFQKILGKIATKNIPKDESIKWKYLR